MVMISVDPVAELRLPDDHAVTGTFGDSGMVSKFIFGRTLNVGGLLSMCFGQDFGFELI